MNKETLRKMTSDDFAAWISASSYDFVTDVEHSGMTIYRDFLSMFPKTDLSIRKFYDFLNIYYKMSTGRSLFFKRRADGRAVIFVDKLPDVKAKDIKSPIEYLAMRFKMNGVLTDFDLKRARKMYRSEVIKVYDFASDGRNSAVTADSYCKRNGI